MPRRKPRRPRQRKVQMAKAYLESGKSSEEVGKDFGVTGGAVRRAALSVLDYQDHEDVQKCRALVNRRIEAMRKPLLEIAGVADIDEGQNKPDPKKIGEHAQRIAAIRALNDLEKRRSEMFGWDAPKLVFTPPPSAGSMQEASLEEIAEECKRNGIPVPPGIRDELARRAEGSDQPTGSQKADPNPPGK